MSQLLPSMDAIDDSCLDSVLQGTSQSYIGRSPLLISGSQAFSYLVRMLKTSRDGGSSSFWAP